ncbi:hypothetical protein S245_070345 [Arachis hypogaea]
MVDVNQRMTDLNPAHIVGLCRLSSQAASVLTTSAPSLLPVKNGLLLFSSLIDKVIKPLRKSGVQVQSDLSDAEFARAEAEFGSALPPDLRAIFATEISMGLASPIGTSQVTAVVMVMVMVMVAVM